MRWQPATDKSDFNLLRSKGFFVFIGKKLGGVMKKTICLLLVLILVTGISTTAFAEEIELTLEMEIESLQQIISDLENNLLNDELSEEELESVTKDLLEFESRLEVLKVEMEDKNNLETILLMEAELLLMEESISALESVDTSEFTDEKLIAHKEELATLISDYDILSIEYSDLKSDKDETDLVVELEGALLILEEQLLDPTLTEEERAILTADILELEAEIEALIESIKIEVETVKTALTEELDILKEKLEDESLTEEEIAEIKSQIEVLEAELNVLNEESNNPNFERFELAKTYDITPGKMNLLEKLKSASELETFMFEDWSERSVKDIMKEIKNYRKSYDIQEDEDNTEDVVVVDEVIDESEDKTVTEEINVKSKGKAKGKNK